MTWGQQEFVRGPGGKVLLRDKNCEKMAENESTNAAVIPETTIKRPLRNWGSHAIPNPTEPSLTAINVTPPTTMHELCNPDFWIADTGASVHSTSYPDYVHNCCPVTSRDAITAAQGTTMLPDKVGELIGALLEKNGKLQFHLVPTVKEIHVIPQGVFNLWSVTKSLTEGWVMT